MVVSELLEYSLPLAMLVEDIYMLFRDGITRLVNGLERVSRKDRKERKENQKDEI